MYVTLKPRGSRTFNGLKIVNADDRPVKLRLEPGTRITEETVNEQQTEIVDTRRSRLVGSMP